MYKLTFIIATILFSSLQVSAQDGCKIKTFDAQNLKKSDLKNDFQISIIEDSILLVCNLDSITFMNNYHSEVGSCSIKYLDYGTSRKDWFVRIHHFEVQEISKKGALFVMEYNKINNNSFRRIGNRLYATVFINYNNIKCLYKVKDVYGL